MSGTTAPADLAGRLTNAESRLTLAESRLYNIEQKLGTSPVTPPVTGPSPDGTVVTNTTDPIRFASGTVFRITTGGQISRTPSGATAPIVDVVTKDVTAIAKLSTTTLVQKNTAGNYYTRLETGPDGAWTQVTPAAAGPLAPATVPPVVSSGAPAAAAAVGYNKRTFGPDLVLGKNWNVTPGAKATQRTATTITCAGAGTANHYNDHVHTLGIFGVGGGAYMEATLSWDNNYAGWGVAGSDGWPAWWSWTTEDTSWPGHPGYANTIEVDFMEAWSNRNWTWGLHDWMTAEPQFATGNSPSPSPLPNDTFHTQPHKYGWLWEPATSTTKGHGSAYLDWQKVAGSDVYWNLYDPALPPPVSATDYRTPSGAGSAFSIIDKNHLHLILGTGTGNPMHVTSVEVWQKDGTRNLPPTA